MDPIKTGALIRQLRRELHLTQQQLADQLCVCHKTISKWERGLGFPDLSLLPRLCEILCVDSNQLLSGTLPEQDGKGVTMKHMHYFVCPLCGSLSLTTGSASVTCCGRPLTPLTPKKAEGQERLTVEEVEQDWYITADHPMEKDNYLSFVAFAQGDRVTVYKQYPEWEVQVRIPRRGRGTLLWYSTTKGLFYQFL